MQKIEWKDSFSVGNDRMDQQHIKLIDMINSMIENSDNVNLVENTVQGMIDYACYHFIDEETHLEDNDYPQLNNQKTQHEYFIDNARQLYTQFATDCDNIEMDKILGFLSTWWTNHILDEDMKYKEYFESKNLQSLGAR